jgi:hypothetical protein
MTKKRAPSPAPPAPRDTILVNKRKIPRQATSRVAFAEMDIPEGDLALDFRPYRHARPRGNSITPEVQRAFIYQLAMSGIVKQAATKVGKSIEALYKLRERPGAEDFRRAWDEALEWGRLRLEDCAMERAIHEGMHNPRANSMLCWVLQHRNSHMVDSREVKRGHWLWERVHYEITGRWSEEEEEEEEEEERRRKATTSPESPVTARSAARPTGRPQRRWRSQHERGFRTPDGVRNARIPQELRNPTRLRTFFDRHCGGGASSQ